MRWHTRALTVLDLLGDTKVGNLDAALVIDQHVRTFDVAMDDIDSFKGFDRCRLLSTDEIRSIYITDLARLQ